LAGLSLATLVGYSVGQEAGHHGAGIIIFGRSLFYVNDKPTGAVIGQQPFGGARASGTNDKAGSWLNLERWVSPRTIKQTFLPPTDFNYPHMAEEQTQTAPMFAA
jgi:1-pyrroline-5-carboxylate dehydrogenase